MPEDSVPIGVEGDGYAEMLYETLDHHEVVVGVPLIAEEGVDYRTGGIIHGQQQCERRSPIPQPSVVTAVQLDRHALSWHPLATDPVLC